MSDTARSRKDHPYPGPQGYPASEVIDDKDLPGTRGGKMVKQIRLLFHDETGLMRPANAFEVEANVLHIWREGYKGIHGEAWYPLNSLRGWEWVED